MADESVERRLTTILAADVVGYSRLMGEDEAGTLAALKAHRKELLEPKSAQYHGRTIKLMGDGALMEFPSVVDAVTFAVEVQCAMRQRNADVLEEQHITFRFGINIGDIIVEGDDIYGEGVNVAARLESLSEPGGICISRTVCTHVKGKVDLTFEDMGEQKVKNIADPVQVFRIILDDAAAAIVTPIANPQIGKSLSWRHHAMAAGLAALLIGIGLAWYKPWAPEFQPASVDRMAHLLPEKPSIAVLPFNNFSGEPEQDYFAEGITEDLITDLSKLSGIFVISRNSSRTYKGKAVKAQQVAEELGVRYLLEGSVRRQGGVVRINAQLIDAVGGHHLWAERYDGKMAKVFELQDEIIGKIVAALAVNITNKEHSDDELGETDNPQAYDALLQGLAHLRLDSEEDTQKAIILFEQAIKLDPEYGRAYAGLAAANWRIASRVWISATGSGFDRAWESVNGNLAKAMNRPTSLAYSITSQVLAQQGRYGEAFDKISQALSLAPNEADIHASKAKILNAVGRAEEAEEAVRWAMRLNPQYAPDFLRPLAVSLFHQERYEEAIETMERVISRQSDVPEDYATLASSFGHLGQSEKVPAMIEKYNALAVPALYDPLTIQEAGMWWYGDIFNYDETYRARFVDGLRKGGVPEGAGSDLSRDDFVHLMRRSNGEYNIEGTVKINIVEAKALFDRGDVVFVDARAAPDFKVAHIPGARNLSLATALSADSLSEIAGKSEEMVFYCHGKYCPTSAYASAKAVAWGFSRIYYFADGFPAWQHAGYNVEPAQTD